MSFFQYYSLLAVVFLIGAVVLFDRLHLNRLWPKCLLSQNDVDALVRIMQACQES